MCFMHNSKLILGNYEIIKTIIKITKVINALLKKNIESLFFTELQL